MIFGNIKNHDVYSKLDKSLSKCIEYITSNNMDNLSKGVYKIDGDEFFFNIVEYNLHSEEERFWEAHRDYLDVHFMINGYEKIRLNFIENAKEKSYDKEKDFVSFESCNENSHVVLHEGDFLLCYPHDVHMTALKVDEDRFVKKAIFKIKI